MLDHPAFAEVGQSVRIEAKEPSENLPVVVAELRAALELRQVAAPILATTPGSPATSGAGELCSVSPKQSRV